MLELRTPLRASWVQVLRLLEGLLRDRQIRYLLSGGNAREILLVHVHGCAPGRVTTDLDFGLIVSDWTLFDDLKAAMEATGCFKRVPTAAQRMVYEVPGARLVVDLVPFGGVARADATLAWPPELDGDAGPRVRAGSEMRSHPRRRTWSRCPDRIAGGLGDAQIRCVG